MMVDLSPTILGRLRRESLFWLATARPDGPPHLAPLWYLWHNQRLYIFTGGVKLRNLQSNPAVSVALQDGVRPAILEGEAVPVTDGALFDQIAARYRARFAWDIGAETGLKQLVEIVPGKVLNWNGENQAGELPIPSPLPVLAEGASPALRRAIARLHREQIVWLATVRPDGRPHLVPIWHVWHQDRLYISTGPHSVKMRNLRHQPRVALSLQNAMDAVLVEGTARPAPELDDELAPHFIQKFDWDFREDAEYGGLVQITPIKILAWQGSSREEARQLL